MEQSDRRASVRVESGQIGSFVQIAFLTAPSEIFRFLRPAVLPGDDVIKVESGEGKMPLVNVAEFATEAGLASNSLAARFVHQVTGDGFRRRRALAWRMATKLPKRT